jgi:hypothetical protein
MGQRQVGVSGRVVTLVRSRRSVLGGGAAAALAAILSARGVSRGMQASGSISVQGFLCPSADAAQGDCQATDEIFNGDIVLAGPNGLVLTLDDGESHAVSHVWFGLPYGSYELQAIGAAPSGYVLDHIDGATVDDAGLEAIVLDDDNPSPLVNLIYVPAG